MHGQQCQGCGAYDDSSTRAVNPCEHCPTPLCQSCKRNHGPLCKELQARKLRGEGPTIANVSVPQHRRGHEAPPFQPADRPDWNPKFGKETKDGSFVWTNVGHVLDEVEQGLVNQAQVDIFAATKLAKLKAETVDQQIDAVKDLSSE